MPYAASNSRAYLNATLYPEGLRDVRYPDDAMTLTATYPYTFSGTVTPNASGQFRLTFAPWCANVLAIESDAALNISSTAFSAGYTTTPTSPIGTYAANFRVVTAAIRVMYTGPPLNAQGTFSACTQTGNGHTITDTENARVKVMTTTDKGVRCVTFPHGLEDVMFLDWSAAQALPYYYQHTNCVIIG
jgi:hypothetical protein